MAEKFTERMSALEKVKSERRKLKLAPISATIGKFSSAFRRFEMNDNKERSHSIDGSLRANVEAPISSTKNSSRASSHSVPRSFEDRNQNRHKGLIKDENKPQEKTNMGKKTSAKKHAGRTVSMPLESTRMIKPLRESTNTPDVVPVGKEEHATESGHMKKFDSETQALKFDRVSHCTSALYCLLYVIKSI